MKKLYLLILIFITTTVVAEQLPDLLSQKQLAITQFAGYKNQLDPIELTWNGEQFADPKSKRQFEVPDWFKQQMPTTKVSGIMGSQTLNSEAILRILRQPKATEAWQKMQFVVVDLLDSSLKFQARLQLLQQLAADNPSTYWRLQTWQQWQSVEQLQQELDQQNQNGEHGYIVYNINAKPNAKNARFQALPYTIAKAEVVAINPGRGHFLGVMGSLEVVDEVGNTFPIGIGYNLKQRENPPAVGTMINYRFRDYTSTGKPRTPVFIGIDTTDAQNQTLQSSNWLTLIFAIFIVALIAIDAVTYYRPNSTHYDFKQVAVSIGILGTFVGIWWGLYSFDSNQVLESVPQLLEGLKFSFATSVIAIALSAILAITQTLISNEK